MNNESTSTSLVVDDQGAVSMDNLYPALVQCFAIIVCGYLAGLFKIISNAETKGLNTFVGTFALPSLIFLSLVELDWHVVNWKFLLSILVSKAIVFFSVIIISLLVIRPLNLGRAGLLAIFCTQSNDFAIGYPIVLALYKKIHPEYASYIYLMAPISLAVLNPIGYVFMELTKMKNNCIENSDEENLIARPIQCAGTGQNENRFLKGRFLVILKTIYSIFFNPILLMTVLGVIGGFAFPNGLPDMISEILKVLGNSFAATSLFLLGLRMIGGGDNTKGPGFLLPGILIIVKLLVLPLVTRQTVNIMNAGSNFTETTDLSTFGFLYGTFPAAPGVFVIATQYNVDIDLIARSMVACTFISGPLMFISAKMISLSTLDPNDYLFELNRFSFDVSIVALIAIIWVFILFAVTKKVKKMPHKITCCLLLSQFISCIGVILWCVLGNTTGWPMYLQFCLFTIGSYSSRLWTAALAIVLLFLQCRSLCFVLKLWPYLIGISWGVPTVLVSLLLIFDSNNISPSDNRNPNFQYGNAQAAIAIFLLVMCFIITVGCLVLHQRYKKRYEKFINLSNEVSTSESTNNLIPPASINNCDSSRNFDEQDAVVQNSCNAKECCSPEVTDIEDILTRQRNEPTNSTNDLCSSQFNCNGTDQQSCQTLIRNYHEQSQYGLEPLEFDANIDDYQTLRHTVLLILLLCSMFVSLSLFIWTLVMDGMSGIYVELSFLDAILNFGQSIIVLAVFVTDTKELLVPAIRFWRKLWYGGYELKLPAWEGLSAETKNVCKQFTTHHLDNCKKSITSNRRWRLRVYKQVCYGNEIVDWLIKIGLAKDRTEAVHYARRLIDGGVLRHINNVFHFYDKNLLYTFCGRL